MTTRTYYFPKTRIGVHVLNYIVERIGCSVGEIKRTADALRVPITCNDEDVKKIERTLKTYGMMED